MHWIVLLAMGAAADSGNVAVASVPYDVGSWSAELGNHRAVIQVEPGPDAVWVALPWRRRDANPKESGS